MIRPRRNNIITAIILIPYLILLYLLQGSVMSRYPIFGAKPLILPVAVVGVSLFDGRYSGGLFGLAAGMLCDLTFNQPTAQFTLILTFLGLSVGYLADTVLVKGFPSFFVCSVGALIVCTFCQIFSPLFFEGAPFPILLEISIRQVLSSLLFTFPVYYLTRLFIRNQ